MSEYRVRFDRLNVLEGYGPETRVPRGDQHTTMELLEGMELKAS